VVKTIEFEVRVHLVLLFFFFLVLFSGDFLVFNSNSNSIGPLQAYHLLMTSSLPPKRPAIWWENTIFFCSTHLAAAYGVYRRPPATVPMPILVATVALWQLSSFGCA
jgi:hypothetical protein